MKIKTKEMSYDKVMELRKYPHLLPKKQSLTFRWLLKTLSKKDLKETNFTYEIEGVLPKEPSLVLMNHSSFIDLEIASTILYPHPFNIVCTSDGFIGKPGLMRALGCIPTNKFVFDKLLVKDIKFALGIKNHVLMYPEASYTFDGCATKFPESIAKMVRLLKCPVIMIKTENAFLRDPLYNMLNKRQVDVKAKVYTINTKEEATSLSVEEIYERISKAFDFDNFKDQYENKIEVTEDFRALGLERILYKCPDCLAEGKTKGEGISFKCNNCGKEYTLNTFGRLEGKGFTPKYSHIPDWYNWERECVKEELKNNEYTLEMDCKIGVLRDFKAIYMIGDGHLKHNSDGFHLINNDKTLDYYQAPLQSYGLYSDYYWYELGDIICIGDSDELYYCFSDSIPVAKARLAQEELYKMKKESLK